MNEVLDVAGRRCEIYLLVRFPRIDHVDSAEFLCLNSDGGNARFTSKTRHSSVPHAVTDTVHKLQTHTGDGTRSFT